MHNSLIGHIATDMHNGGIIREQDNLQDITVGIDRLFYDINLSPLIQFRQ